MVLPITDEEARFKSMARCPRFPDCESPLCPLDPHLKQKVTVLGTPLCYWYVLMNEVENFAEMPPCVIEVLPEYIVHLIKCGALPVPRTK